MARRIIATVGESKAALRGATVTFDDRAVLREVHLELPSGMTILRGPNGAGKTTALRALAGLVPLVRGERDVPEDLLYLGHRPQLLHGLTARENLRFLAGLRGRAVDDARISAALGRWGVRADPDRTVEKLSAGERRRASLARIELEPCSVMLLDEPFADLDADATLLLRRVLSDAAGTGAALLVVSHSHAELDADARAVREIRDGVVA